MRYDAIVVGGGPAGATAARELAEAGARVLLLERHRLPRYKACGGCLSRRVAALLPLDLKKLVEEEITSVTFTYRGRDSIEARFNEWVACTVWRDRFDQALCVSAVEAGVELRDGIAVRGARDLGDHVEIEFGRGREAADFVIGADGASGVVARDLVPGRPRAGAVGLDGALPLAAVADATLRGRVVIELGRAPGGYCWAFPKGRVASVGIMVGRAAGRSAARRLSTFLHVAGLNDRHPSATHGALIPVHRAGFGPLHRGRALLVGDAAALVDPFLGEGIYYAVLSGQLAARALVAAAGNGGDLAPYGQRVAAEILPELEAAGQLGRLAHRWPWFWFKALKRRPGAIELFRKVLMGDATYRSFARRVCGEVPMPLARLLGLGDHGAGPRGAGSDSEEG
jgi:geranylgeranyl reductase family protein